MNSRIEDEEKMEKVKERIRFW